VTALYDRAWSVNLNGSEVKGYDLTFRVERDTSPSPNKAEVVVYNLPDTLRAALSAAKDPEVQITAGYTERNGVLYRGQARDVVHARANGGVDWATKILCGDGEARLRMAQSSKSYAPGTSVGQVVADLVKDLGYTDTAGATGKFFAATIGRTYQQGTVLEGPSKDELTAILASFGWEWSIQSGVLQMSPIGVPYAPSAVLLSAATGLIDPAPTLSPKGELRATALLHPDVGPGCVVAIVSRAVQGQFRVEKCTYAGDTAGNTWQVEIEGKAQ
jgi:hypothetical protein